MRKGIENFPHVLSHFYGSPWAIMPEKLAELHRVLWKRIEGGGAEIVQLEQMAAGQRATTPGGGFSPSSSSPGKIPTAETLQATKTENGYALVGSAAVIRIRGVISSRASVFDDWSGGTSHEAVGRATDAALADGKAETIVYDVDSPGGVVFGQPENAEKVLAAKKTKPTIAVANHLAASAAYWYLSQAAEAIISPSGLVGCVGVIIRAVDETEALKLAGIRDVLVSNTGSPYKTEGYPQVPFTEEQRADMQYTADRYADMFVQAIAKGRGLRAPTVEKDFGKGRTLIAEDALSARMVDKIETLESVLNRVNNVKTRATQRRVAADMARHGLPTKKG